MNEIYPDKTEYEIGVIIGRFQVHELHEAHCQVIDHVISKHKKVILFLGVSPVLGSTNNPLDFTSRKLMIQDKYPDINIVALPDQSSDNSWSNIIDTRISEIYPIGKALLYGSRDSFIPYYTGRMATRELEQTIYVSGSEVRKNVSDEVKASSDWRAGVIYQSYNKYPVSYQTVDIAVISEDGRKILMARKPNETKLRFVGGFVDPTDESLEHAAKREFMEETGGNIEIDNLQYLGSFRINDWRYKSERDKIMTTFFVSKYIFGNICPSDDIIELRWVEFESLKTEKNMVVIEHLPLVNKLIKHIEELTDTHDGI